MLLPALRKTEPPFIESSVSPSARSMKMEAPLSLIPTSISPPPRSDSPSPPRAPVHTPPTSKVATQNSATTTTTTTATTTAAMPHLEDSYSFPRERLRTTLKDPSRTPLVLVACGSFSPPTLLHLRMFEVARDFIKTNTSFEVLGGYLSPVSDAYKKVGLESAEHRIAMCSISVKADSDWLMVDPWEALSGTYRPTAQVLDHFEHELNSVVGGVATGPHGRRTPYQIAFLCGSDLAATMGVPGVWSHEDLDHILGQYKIFVLERHGTDMDTALAALLPWKANIYVMPQLIPNEISSTRVRIFLRKSMSVRYLISSPVMEYIEQLGLYSEEDKDRELRRNGVSGGEKEAGEERKMEREEMRLENGDGR